MKKMIFRKTGLLLLVILSVLLTPLAVSAGGAAIIEKKTYKFDSDADMIGEHAYFKEYPVAMSNDSRQKIFEKLEKASEELQLDIGVWTSNSVKRDVIELHDLMDQALDNTLNNPGYYGKVFLYLDLAQGFHRLGTSGDAVYYFPDTSISEDDRHQKILTAVFQAEEAAKDQSYLKRVEIGVDTLIEQLRYYKNLGPVQELPDHTLFSAAADNLSDDPQVFRSDSVYIYDEYGKFSQSDKQRIVDAFSNTSKEIQFNLALYIGSESRSDGTIEKMAKDGAYDLFKFDKYNGTVYLYIDMDGLKNAYDYMYAVYDARLFYTNGDAGSADRIDKILERMETHFPPGGGEIIPSEIADGLEEYCRQLRKYKEDGGDEDYYYYDERTGEYVSFVNGAIKRSDHKPYRYFWFFLVGSIAAGVAVALIISGVVKKRYQFKSSVSVSAYTSREKMNMRHSEDTFIGSHVSKVKIQTSSGGGHSGGGGGHSSGGGGGRHR